MEMEINDHDATASVAMGSFNSSTIYLWPMPAVTTFVSPTPFNTLTSIATSVSSVVNKELNNYWALLALFLVFATAAGNILVCLAITWERRLQNVTNYFLMSLAITDLMVAILVMPLGILTLVRGYFPLQSEHCLAWICLDVLFCTASIMHLCTISVDRYLSLRYPMRFGRNKTRRRVTLKIIFVWLLSIAMSLPLSLMYSKDHASVLVDGTCQIPDPVYKLVGSIVCFYIPFGVMLLTYCLTVRLLARQRQNLGLGGSGSGGASSDPRSTTTGWASGWLGQTPALERRCTWRRLLKNSLPSTPNHAHSAASTDTELTTLDTHELWLPDTSIPEPTPSTMTALHQFGAEMLKLSRGLESVSTDVTVVPTTSSPINKKCTQQLQDISCLPPLPTHPPPPKPKRSLNMTSGHNKKQEATTCSQGITRLSPSPTVESETLAQQKIYRIYQRRRTSVAVVPPKRDDDDESPSPTLSASPPPTDKRPRFYSLRRSTSLQLDDTFLKELQARTTKKTTNRDHLELPPPCTCPYFGHKSSTKPNTEVRIIQPAQSFRSSSASIHEDSPLITPRLSIVSTVTNAVTTTSSNIPISSPTRGGSLSVLSVPKSVLPVRKLSYSKTGTVVTWDSTRYQRRGSSFGTTRTSLLVNPSKITKSPLRRSATLRHHKNVINGENISGSNINSIVSGGSHKIPSSPCLLQRTTTIRSHHSRNSSVISRNSSRHGRIIRLEQKATKVLGVVFFTFVILWAPFFVLNLLPTVCAVCEQRISHWVFDVVTWLGYASSMVNPIFYTIFNKVFRQAFKKVLMCKYGKTAWRPHR